MFLYHQWFRGSENSQQSLSTYLQIEVINPARQDFYDGEANCDDLLIMNYAAKSIIACPKTTLGSLILMCIYTSLNVSKLTFYLLLIRLSETNETIYCIHYTLYRINTINSLRWQSVLIYSSGWFNPISRDLYPIQDVLQLTTNLSFIILL